MIYFIWDKSAASCFMSVYVDLKKSFPIDTWEDYGLNEPLWNAFRRAYPEIREEDRVKRYCYRACMHWLSDTLKSDNAVKRTPPHGYEGTISFRPWSPEAALEWKDRLANILPLLTRADEINPAILDFYADFYDERIRATEPNRRHMAQYGFTSKEFREFLTHVDAARKAEHV